MDAASSSLTFIFFLIITSSSLLLNSALASASGSKGKVEVPKFNYSKTNNWGRIDPQFVTCSTGKRQSPVDIRTCKVIPTKTLGILRRKYHVYNASLHTNGLDVEVRFNVRGGLIIDGKAYSLTQMHWHTPSEHRLNGVQYAAELHQVHVAKDGSRAVVGVLHKEGPPNPVLTMLQPQLEELGKKPCEGEQEVGIPKFDTKFIKRNPTHQYYRYIGSLTTPPCDENVIWTILSKVKTISKDQVAALEAPACAPDKKNARPPQELNGRTILKYQPN